MLSRISAPSAALVTVDEAKAHCRIDGDDENAVISALISAVADYLDGPSGILGRAILDQTWRLELASWPTFVEIQIEPVRSAEVRYLDAFGAEQVLDPAAYRLVALPGAAPALQWVSGDALPQLGRADFPIVIDFAAGFGGPEDVPAPIRLAALMLIDHWYNSRGLSGGDPAELPLTCSALLARYRKVL